MNLLFAKKTYQLIVAIFLFLIPFKSKSQCTYTSLGIDDFNQPSYNIVYNSVIKTDLLGSIYLAFRDELNQNKITVMKYNDSSWGVLGQEGFSLGEVENVSMAIYNNMPYVVYRDEYLGGKGTVMRFNGTSWIIVGSSGITPNAVQEISIDIDTNGVPYIFYSDVSGTGKVSVMRYNGVTWEIVGVSGFSLGIAATPSGAIDASGIPYVVYNDVYSNGKATVMKFNGSTWEVVGIPGFTMDVAGTPTIAFNTIGTPYIAYHDFYNNGRATVMKFNGSIWEFVGQAGFSSGEANSPSISIDSNDIPYLIYGDMDRNNSPTVMKFNGIIWQYLDTSSISNINGTFSSSMALASNGNPIIAYRDQNNNGKAVVKKYNGIKWEGIGNAKQLLGESNFTSLSIDSNGVLYALCNYRDNLNNNKINVKKYNGLQWEYLDSTYLSSIVVSSTSSLITRNGSSYIAYSDFNNSNKVTVLKFNGTTWSPVGNTGFSLGQASRIVVNIDNNEVVFVAYIDHSNSNKITVMKFDGTNWVVVGNQGFSLSPALDISFTINNSTPYIAYTNSINNTDITVMKFDGINWLPVGIPNFYPEAGSISLDIDKMGIPYVAFVNHSDNNKVKVMKFDGVNWNNVGNIIIENGYFPVIKVDNGGTPIVALIDQAKGDRAKIYKYTANSWTSITDSYLSAGQAIFLSMAIDSVGTPTILYSNGDLWLKKINENISDIFMEETIEIVQPYSGIFKNSCKIIAMVTPHIISGISGVATSKVWIENVQPISWVKRHYEILPDNNVLSSGGFVTLYFTQSEFDDFNSINIQKLPTNPTDILGKSNLRVDKRAGASMDNSGLPETYGSASTIIDPLDSDIVWNEVQKRWEVSFSVIGFGGFFIKTNNSVLPLKLLSFTGIHTNSINNLIWKTANESNIKNYEVQYGKTATAFTTIKTVPANNKEYNEYTATHIPPQADGEASYYRIKITENDGKTEYSKIVTLNNDKQSTLNIYPNPAKDNITIQLADNSLINTEAVILNAQGKTILKQKIQSTNQLINLSTLSQGIYFVKFANGDVQKIVVK